MQQAVLRSRDFLVGAGVKVRLRLPAPGSWLRLHIR